MGRFASTASTYEHLRPPYPGEFFRSATQKLGLSKRCALIDLGTGPGLVARDGAILICASFSVTDGRNPWLDGYNEIRRRWSPAKPWEEAGKGVRTHRDLPAFFRGSAFVPTELVTVETSHTVSMQDLAQRTLTYSSSSPEALGDNVEALLQDVESHLASFGRDGLIAETIISTAQIVKR